MKQLLLTTLALTTLLPAAFGSRHFAFSNEAKRSHAGEIEFEQWVTWKTGKNSDHDFDRFDFRTEIEYAFTDRLVAALYIADWRHQESSAGSETTFRSVGAEVIYNLIDPSQAPLGASLYLETKIGDELLVVEPKLLLQKNFANSTLVYNAILEAEWEGPAYHEDIGILAQTIGYHYKLTDYLHVGAELVHEVEYADWANWGPHVVYAGPSIYYKKGHFRLALAPLIQLTDIDDEPDFQTRAIITFEF